MKKGQSTVSFPKVAPSRPAGTGPMAEGNGAGKAVVRKKKVFPSGMQGKWGSQLGEDKG